MYMSQKPHRFGIPNTSGLAITCFLAWSTDLISAMPANRVLPLRTVACAVLGSKLIDCCALTIRP